MAIPELVARTRRWSVAATGLLGMWLFGNVYEEIVWIPALIADPRPGTLVDTWALGSPVYYYLPWTPLSVALVVAMRLRFSEAPESAKRAWNRALGSLGIGLVAKIGLITLVNPVFRDPAASVEVVHDRAVLWACGNGVAIVAVAVALAHLTAWRRL